MEREIGLGFTIILSVIVVIALIASDVIAGEATMRAKKIQADQLLDEGVAACHHANYRRAIDLFEDALRLFREIGDRRGEGSSLNNIGICYYSLTEYERAIDYHEQSLALFRDNGDLQGEAASLDGLGTCYHSLGDYERAIDYHGQSLAIRRETDDCQGEAKSLHNLGNCYFSLGKYTWAVDYYKQSLVIKREIGDRQGEAVSLENLGNCYYSLREYGRASGYYEQSLAITEEIGAMSWHVQWALGRLYWNLSQLERAQEYYEQAIAGVETICSRIEEVKLRQTFLTRVRELYRQYLRLLFGKIQGDYGAIPDQTGPRTDDTTSLGGFSLEGYKTFEGEHGILTILSRLLQENSSLYLELCYSHPEQLNREEDYSVVEAIYGFLLDQGLYGRVITRHRRDVDADKPEIFIVHREHPVAPDSVPNEIIELVEQFLTAWTKRDQTAIELFSSRVRESFSDEDLQSFISGTSNPHHCGYFIHSITPYRDEWTVVVSLFDHYTGYNLELDPETGQCSFNVARRKEQYVIDSLPYLEEKTIQLVQDGTLYSLRFVERIREAPQPYTFTVHAEGELLYRSVGYWLAVDRVEDVTGDGFREVVLKRSMGGNCVGCSSFYVLRLAEDKVTPLWPDKDVICPHDDCGCEGMLKDLDGDGIPELLTTDARFGYWGPLSNYCTAGQPYVPIVYSWDGNHYHYASMDFPEAYQGILERIQSTAPEDVRNIDPYGEYGSIVYSLFSELVQLMLCYDHMGLKDAGWKEVQRLVQEWDFEVIWDAYAIEHEESPLHVYLDDLHEVFFSAARSPD